MRSAMKTGILLGGLLALAGCALYRPPTADVWGFQATSKQWGLTVLYTPSLTQCQTARADVVRGGTADWTSFSECGPVRIVAGNGGFAFSIRTIVDQGALTFNQDVGDSSTGLAFSEATACAMARDHFRSARRPTNPIPWSVPFPPGVYRTSYRVTDCSPIGPVGRP
jgi:hypothetical protein